METFDFTLVVEGAANGADDAMLFEQDGVTFVAFVECSATAVSQTADGDEAPETVLVIEARLGMGDEVSECFSADEQALDAFGEVNVSFSAYPNLRELVPRLTSRSGLPSLTLGVVRSPLDVTKEKGGASPPPD